VSKVEVVEAFVEVDAPPVNEAPAAVTAPRKPAGGTKQTIQRFLDLARRASTDDAPGELETELYDAAEQIRELGLPVRFEADEDIDWNEGNEDTGPEVRAERRFYVDGTLVAEWGFTVVFNEYSADGAWIGEVTRDTLPYPEDVLDSMGDEYVRILSMDEIESKVAELEEVESITAVEADAVGRAKAPDDDPAS